MHSVIRSYPFTVLVTQTPTGVSADHLPLLLVTTGGSGVLQGHIARANPLSEQIDDGAEVLAIFQGPNRYVSPNWYPSKEQHGKVVPTWNYVAVHARGRIRWKCDEGWLRDHLEALTVANECTDNPWHVSDAPVEFINRMLSGIVGFEVPIAELSGKWKLSQNRSQEDRQGVIEGLKTQSDTSASEMLRWMESNERGT